jgi:hypothetical protein
VRVISFLDLGVGYPSQLHPGVGHIIAWPRGWIPVTIDILVWGTSSSIVLGVGCPLITSRGWIHVNDISVRNTSLANGCSRRQIHVVRQKLEFSGYAYLPVKIMICRCSNHRQQNPPPGEQFSDPNSTIVAPRSTSSRLNFELLSHTSKCPILTATVQEGRKSIE